MIAINIAEAAVSMAEAQAYARFESGEEEARERCILPQLGAVRLVRRVRAIAPPGRTICSTKREPY